MTKINVKKSELVSAFSQYVTKSYIVSPYRTQWICPYINSYGDLVYCIIRLDLGGMLSQLPYRTLRVMANLLDGNDLCMYVFTIRYSSNLDKCYLLIDKEQF